MHFQVGISTEPVDFDETLFSQPQGFKRFAFLSAAIRPPFPRGGDQGFQFVTGTPLPEGSAKIKAVLGARQRYHIPSAVSRLRSQERQKVSWSTE